MRCTVLASSRLVLVSTDRRSRNHHLSTLTGLDILFPPDQERANQGSRNQDAGQDGQGKNDAKPDPKQKTDEQRCGSDL